MSKVYDFIKKHPKLVSAVVGGSAVVAQILNPAATLAQGGTQSNGYPTRVATLGGVPVTVTGSDGRYYYITNEAYFNLLSSGVVSGRKPNFNFNYDEKLDVRYNSKKIIE